VTVPEVAVIVTFDWPIGVVAGEVPPQPTTNPANAVRKSNAPNRRRGWAPMLVERRRKIRMDAKGRSRTEVVPAAYVSRR
jgi:hypothetical protein